MLEALIPFVTVPSYELAKLPVIGPLRLQVFGPLVAAGVICGYHLCLRFARRRDIDEFIARDLMFWVLVTGFVISHWVSVLFYFPEDVKENPLILLMIWNGLSSVGGFFGALVGFFWYLRKMKQPYLIYADMLLYGLVVGFTFGRLGCALVHDHPGPVVDPSHPLAVGPWTIHIDRRPEIFNQYALDLGLIEFLFLVPVALFIHFGFKWETSRPGKLVGLMCLLYAPFRFGLDLLRGAQDARYLGLTTANYATAILLIIGVYLVFIRKAAPEDLAWSKDSERIAREAAEKAAGKEPPKST